MSANVIGSVQSEPEAGVRGQSRWRLLAGSLAIGGVAAVVYAVWTTYGSAVDTEVATQSLADMAAMVVTDLPQRALETLRNSAGACLGLAYQWMPHDLLSGITRGNGSNFTQPTVSTNLSIFSNTPQHLMTPEFLQQVISKSPYLLNEVPQHLMTPDFLQQVIRKFPFLLDEVPQHLITLPLAELAVDGWSSAIEFVPSHLIPALLTPERAQEVVTSDGSLLKYIPREMIKLNLLVLALLTDKEAIRYVPPDMITQEFALLSVRWNGEMLEYVPEWLKTNALCLEAVLNSELARPFIPESLREQLNQMEQESLSALQEPSLPTTGPLPQMVQDFIDKYPPDFLNLNAELPLGFKRLGAGSFKTILIHDKLPGYVLKFPHEGMHTIKSANAAIVAEATTMLHLQKIVANESLHQIVIPAIYLLVRKGYNMLVQERVYVENATGDCGQEQLSALINHADQQFYPDIDPITKNTSRDTIFSFAMNIIENALKGVRRPTAWQAQLRARAWVWDLAAKVARNVGMVRGKNGSPNLLAIFDGAL